LKKLIGKQTRYNQRFFCRRRLLVQFDFVDNVIIIIVNQFDHITGFEHGKEGGSINGFLYIVLFVFKIAGQEERLFV